MPVACAPDVSWTTAPTLAPGQRQTWYPWPYVEGLTIAEATNELAFLVTGAYGKPVSKQIDEQADIYEFLFQYVTGTTLNEQQRRA